MISLEDRQRIARAVEEAHRDGARLRCACAEAGTTLRTLQRWKRCEGLEHGDRRPQAVRPVPALALSEAERAEILRIANEPRFAELPPARIVPMLADEGTYVASASPRLDSRWGGFAPFRCGLCTRWERQAWPGAPKSVEVRS